MLIKIGANFGGDGETSRYGQADVGHFGEVGTFAAEKVFHIRSAVGLAVAEEINVLALCHVHRPRRGPRRRGTSSPYQLTLQAMYGLRRTASKPQAAYRRRET